MVSDDTHLSPTTQWLVEPPSAPAVQLDAKSRQEALRAPTDVATDFKALSVMEHCRQSTVAGS